MTEIEVQAECYRLIKQNQELTSILQQAMGKAKAQNVQELMEAIKPAPKKSKEEYDEPAE